jgi:polar amino acid transport system substrate-binding protein
MPKPSTHNIADKLIAGLLMSLLSITAMAQKPLPEIRIFTEVRDAAETRADDQGNVWVDNPASRLLETLLVEADLGYEVAIVPWTRLIQNLENQVNTIGYPLVRTPERESRFLWLGLIRPIDNYLYGLRENAEQLPSTLVELDSYSIGTIRGDVFDQYFQSLGLTNVVRFGNGTPWLQMMERGRIDLMPFAEHGIEEYLQRHEQPVDKLVPAIRLDSLSTGLYFVMHPDSDELLVQRLQQAYASLLADGRYYEIMGLTAPEPEQ